MTKTHSRALTDILKSDFAGVQSDLLDTDQYVLGKGSRGWVGFRDQEPINFETVYAHCLLQPSLPYLTARSQDLNRTALLKLQILMSIVFNVNTYINDNSGSINLDLLDQFVGICTTSTHGITSQKAVFYTTNYDNLIEEASESIEKAWKYPGKDNTYKHAYSLSQDARGQRTKGTLDALIDEASSHSWVKGPRYCKIHGSITFFACTNQSCDLASTFHHLPELKLFERNCPRCGSFTIPGIVPPTTLKDYRSSSHSCKYVSQLFVALEQATRVILCGYSFPETDTLLNSRVLNGLRRGKGLAQVHVIDKYSCDRICRAIDRSCSDKRIKAKRYTSIAEFVEKSHQI
jgi:hypothetical protein